jgi:hypothetical protein
MFTRRSLIGALLLLACGIARAQAPRAASSLTPVPPGSKSQAPATPPSDGAQGASSGGFKWRAAGTVTRASAVGDSTITPSAPSVDRQPISRVTKGPDTLPNEAGQEWREYDISPYTARVTSTNRPEQAILDWILRETGYEAWHTQPLAILNIDKSRLSVYHTPQMHAVVSEMVDRFVNTEAEMQAFGMRVITVDNPNWRAVAHRSLHPVAAQTQGVQAWLLAKEDAALLAADLRKRSGTMEHSTPHLLVSNGQSRQVSATRTRNYIRDLTMTGAGFPGFEPQMAQYDEGFKLEFNPLLSLDGKVVDAVVRCEVDLVEKLIPVMIDVTTAIARQRQRIDVPQAISSRLHERFRWPVDQVLLISLGVGPSLVPPSNNTLGVNVPLISSSTRTELLVFVESKGKVTGQPTALQPGQPQVNSYRNRY